MPSAPHLVSQLNRRQCRQNEGEGLSSEEEDSEDEEPEEKAEKRDNLIELVVQSQVRGVCGTASPCKAVLWAQSVHSCVCVGGQRSDELRVYRV